MKIKSSLFLIAVVLSTSAFAETELTAGVPLSGGGILFNFNHLSEYDTINQSKYRTGWGVTYAKQDWVNSHGTKNDLWIGLNFLMPYDFLLPSNEVVSLGPLFGLELKEIDAPNLLQWQWGLNGRYRWVSFGFTNEQINLGINFQLDGPRSVNRWPVFSASRKLATFNAARVADSLKLIPPVVDTAKDLDPSKIDSSASSQMNNYKADSPIPSREPKH